MSVCVRTRVLGGRDGGKTSEGEGAALKKLHAACVNWLMLPPFCQINSTGQGRGGGGGEECEWGAGFSPFIKGPFNPLFSGRGCQH